MKVHRTPVHSVAAFCDALHDQLEKCVPSKARLHSVQVVCGFDYDGGKSLYVYFETNCLLDWLVFAEMWDEDGNELARTQGLVYTVDEALETMVDEDDESMAAPELEYSLIELDVQYGFDSCMGAPSEERRGKALDAAERVVLAHAEACGIRVEE